MWASAFSDELAEKVPGCRACLSPGHHHFYIAFANVRNACAYVHTHVRSPSLWCSRALAEVRVSSLPPPCDPMDLTDPVPSDLPTSSLILTGWRGVEDPLEVCMFIYWMKFIFITTLAGNVAMSSRLHSTFRAIIQWVPPNIP